MLMIRKEQMGFFDECVSRSFKNRVFAHLIKVWPERCKEIGESEVRASIEKGIGRAANYKITSEMDVVGFIDLMYVHGWDFDRDIRLPWASDILTDPDLHPSRKMERLLEITERVLGFPPRNP